MPAGEARIRELGDWPQRCSATCDCTPLGRVPDPCTNLALALRPRACGFSAMQLAHLLLKKD